MVVRSYRFFNVRYRSGAEVFCHLEKHVGLFRITANHDRICHFNGVLQSEEKWRVFSGPLQQRFIMFDRKSDYWFHGVLLPKTAIQGLSDG